MRRVPAFLKIETGQTGLLSVAWAMAQLTARIFGKLVVNFMYVHH